MSHFNAAFVPSEQRALTCSCATPPIAHRGEHLEQVGKTLCFQWVIYCSPSCPYEQLGNVHNPMFYRDFSNLRKMLTCTCNGVTFAFRQVLK
jgi:hypothetical protein